MLYEKKSNQITEHMTQNEKWVLALGRAKARTQTATLAD